MSSDVPTPDASDEFFAQRPNVRLTEQLNVIKIDLVNFHTTLRPGPPSHLRIFDIVKRLLRTLEQEHRSAEDGGA